MTEEPAESRGCLHNAGWGALLFSCSSGTYPSGCTRGARVTAQPEGPRRIPPFMGAAGRIAHNCRGWGGVASQGCTADGGAAGQTRKEREAQKGKLTPREGSGSKGPDRPCTAPSFIEEKDEWEEAVPGNPRGWKRGFQGNTPRNVSLVTLKKAPCPSPTACLRPRPCLPLGNASLVASPLALLYTPIVVRDCLSEAVLLGDRAECASAERRR